MVITLYHFPQSGPSRGALLAAKAVGVEVDLQIVDLFKKEQLKEDFIKVRYFFNCFVKPFENIFSLKIKTF